MSGAPGHADGGWMDGVLQWGWWGRDRPCPITFLFLFFRLSRSLASFVVTSMLLCVTWEIVQRIDDATIYSSDTCDCATRVYALVTVPNPLRPGARVNVDAVHVLFSFVLTATRLRGAARGEGLTEARGV